MKQTLQISQKRALWDVLQDYNPKYKVTWRRTVRIHDKNGTKNENNNRGGRLIRSARLHGIYLLSTHNNFISP